MMSVINVFARAVVRQRKIPFGIFGPEVDITGKGAMQAFLSLREQAKENRISDMNPEEINKEISTSVWSVINDLLCGY